MRRECWIAILIALIWVGSWTCIIAYEWSGENVPSRDDLFWFEGSKGAYYSWGKQHPECRNRFGFWPDGSRMSDDEVDEISTTIGRMFQSPKTPEQKARDKWTRDVQAKIASCEEDQWMPLAQTSALRQLRIGLIESIIVFSLLPPFFIIAGLGLMTRARGISTRTAGKFITTIGALLSASAIASFFAYISDKFNSVVITYLDGDRFAIIHNGPRLGVIFATLAPVGIVLWWRRPIAGSKPVLACCLGIAAGLAPVLTQIICWPFIYYSPNGVRATAVVATFGAASLSAAATTRILKGDKGVKQNKFDHIQKGLRRLYITLLIPWVAWFGYAAYESSHSIRFANSQSNKFLQYTEWLDRLDDNNQVRDARRRMAADQLEVMRLVWDVRTNDELLKSVDSSMEQSRDRLTNDVYALLAGVMPFLLYPIALWVIAGFRKPAQENEAKTPTSAAPPTSAPHLSVTDYQSAIERAVSELADNTPETRQALYERARATLASQLSGQDLPNSHIAREMRLLNAAIRSAGNYASISSRMGVAKRGSTTLLVLSIFISPQLWLVDVTCMSLYWVARLPKDLWKNA